MTDKQIEVCIKLAIDRLEALLSGELTPQELKICTSILRDIDNLQSWF
jgi:hypothetical protein